MPCKQIVLLGAGHFNYHRTVQTSPSESGQTYSLVYTQSLKPRGCQAGEITAEKTRRHIFSQQLLFFVPSRLPPGAALPGASMLFLRGQFVLLLLPSPIAAYIVRQSVPSCIHTMNLCSAWLPEEP